jgi:hypothetical protein
MVALESTRCQDIPRTFYRLTDGPKIGLRLEILVVGVELELVPCGPDHRGDFSAERSGGHPASGEKQVGAGNVEIEIR